MILTLIAGYCQHVRGSSLASLPFSYQDLLCLDYLCGAKSEVVILGGHLCDRWEVAGGAGGGRPPFLCRMDAVV